MSNKLSGPTAVVIGGGVIGLSTAWALRARGYRVTVLERGALAMEASWAGGGILSPLPPWQADAAIWTLAQRSLALYPALCAQLLAETGIDPEWWQCGMDVVDMGSEAEAMLWCAQQGLACERVIRNEAGDTVNAINLPWVAQIRNPRFCRALAMSLRMQGVALHEHCGSVAIEVEAGGAVACFQDRREQADVVVVAAGAWSAQLLSPLQWSLPIKPVKGQMLALQTDGDCIERIVLSNGRYLIPRRDGMVLVGSTLEDCGFDKRTSAAALTSLRDFASSINPSLGKAKCTARWAGLRPGSPDGLPTIEKHPEISNLYVNTGHFRYGLTLALASAERLLTLTESG